MRRPLVVLGATLAVVAVAVMAGLALSDEEPAAVFLAPRVPVAVSVQEPFLCTTEHNGLGQPIVDNDDRRGTPVYPEDERGQPDRTQAPLGWSENCQAERRVTYHYRDAEGRLHKLPLGVAELPADVAWIEVADLIGAQDMDLAGAERVPYLLRLERGTLPEQRFIYSIAMLVPWEEVTGEVQASRAHWNRRLVYSFGGGVGIGHSQGMFSLTAATLDEPMRLGHAALYSTGTVTAVHYHLLRGGLVALEAKGRFVAEHGEPRFTVGIGGSGGAIQQYVYSQNHPELLDAAIPLASYPDMTTQTIHIGDCELLERYMDVIDAGNDRWSDWDQRRIVQGLNSIEGFRSRWQEKAGATGSSECIEGWRGSIPLTLNPTFGFPVGLERVVRTPEYRAEILEAIERGQPPVPENFPDIGRLLRVTENPEDWAELTHWSDVRDVYGTDPDTGYARVSWDNVGLQYGLRAVANGTLSPAEFLDLNARIGAWVEPYEAASESCGLVAFLVGPEMAHLAREIGMCEGEELDRHSSRQMRQSLDPARPAPRREGDVEAIRGAFESGLVFDGDLPRTIPVIDARHYLEHRLDMHNSHQSFAARERIRRAQGHHDNHLIWFLDARPEVDAAATSELLTRAFRMIDEWLLNIEAEPGQGVAAARPPAAVDSCFATTGELIASGHDVWSGAVELIESGLGDWTDEAPAEVEGTPVGACTRHFPLHSTSRIAAGAPITGDIYKCRTMPVREAVAEGLYGVWEPTEAEIARLEAIHPEGVCDYRWPSVGRPGPRP